MRLMMREVHKRGGNVFKSGGKELFLNSEIQKKKYVKSLFP